MKTWHRVSYVTSLLAILCVEVPGVVGASPQDDIVVLESQQEVVEAAREPLRCGAVAAAESIENMLEAATTGNTLLPGQVAYGSTFMSRMAYHYRWGQGLLQSGTNVAVFEYLASAGRRGYLILESRSNREGALFLEDLLFNGHAEKRLATSLGALGIEPVAITAIYSELSPCIGGSNCAAFLAKAFPNAVVTFTFEYAATEAARKAAVALLKRAVASCK